MRFLLLLSLSLLLASCRAKHEGPYRVRLLIFGEMKDKNVRSAAGHFKTFLPGEVLVDTLKLPMPAEAYYKPRNRYRADILLRLAAAEKEDYDLLVAITDLPVSNTVHGYKDYGICGLSFLGDNVCLASSFHLDREMFLQIIRHEWGHGTLDISHCKHKMCIMNAANGKVENLRGHSSFESGCGKIYRRFIKTMQPLTTKGK